MIDMRLVLVFLPVYTFDMSKTTFEDKDIVSMSIRGHGTLVVGIDAGALLTGPAHAWCGYTIETPILHLDAGTPRDGRGRGAACIAPHRIGERCARAGRAWRALIDRPSRTVRAW